VCIPLYIYKSNEKDIYACKYNDIYACKYKYLKACRPRPFNMAAGKLVSTDHLVLVSVHKY
jgi:hypothetical protein